MPRRPAFAWVAALALAAPAGGQEIKLGVGVKDIEPAPRPENVQVKRVDAKALADRLGIRPNDLFVKINDTPITSADELQRAPAANTLVVVWKSGERYLRNVARKIVPAAADDYAVDLPPGELVRATVQEQVPVTMTRTVTENGVTRTVPVTTYQAVTRVVLVPRRMLGVDVVPVAGGYQVTRVYAGLPATRGNQTVAGKAVPTALEPGDVILTAGPLADLLNRADPTVTLTVRDVRTGQLQTIAFDLEPHETLLAAGRRRNNIWGDDPAVTMPATINPRPDN